MKNFLSFIFKKTNKWHPVYQPGELLLALKAELKNYSTDKNDTMIVEVLERDNFTHEKYYCVLTNHLPLMTDAQDNPIPFYIHEKNIIGRSITDTIISNSI